MTAKCFQGERRQSPGINVYEVIVKFSTFLQPPNLVMLVVLGYQCFDWSLIRKYVLLVFKDLAVFPYSLKKHTLVCRQIDLRQGVFGIITLY